MLCCSADDEQSRAGAAAYIGSRYRLAALWAAPRNVVAQLEIVTHIARPGMWAYVTQNKRPWLRAQTNTKKKKGYKSAPSMSAPYLVITLCVSTYAASSESLPAR